jgi:hypothetical protein
MGTHTPVPADGLTARWRTWDGDDDEVLTLRWENEGWTATGEVGRERVHYALRLSPLWQVRQFLLFRDLAEPDLWLATDGRGRWGEMNGAHRPELDVELACTPFTHTLPIRRLGLGPGIEIGDELELTVIAVDVQTLSVVPAPRRLARLGERRWRHTNGEPTSYDVDEYGLVLDLPDAFRRL